MLDIIRKKVWGEKRKERRECNECRRKWVMKEKEVVKMG